MILKEKTLTKSHNPKLRAGEDAERQMAFYLHRALGKKNDCLVINDLRLIHNEDVAQIDHLIVTQFGLFIIESKSVHGKIFVNRLDEWSRTYNGEIDGMPSPVLQGEAQGQILKNILTDNAEQLLGKILFGKLQKSFGYCPVLVYVAISDNGIIHREKDVPELFKADQISQKILARLDVLKKSSNLLSLSLDAPWKMNLGEVKTIAEFLLTQHQPLINTLVSTPKTEFKQLIKNNPEHTFIPKIGAICPECKKHKLIRKSIKRSDNTETDFLACAGYPKECKTIFALVAVANPIYKNENTVPVKLSYKENDACPNCKNGTLVRRKAKTEFLGCSQYPICKFTDYRNVIV